MVVPRISKSELAKLRQRLQPKPLDIFTDPEKAAKRGVQRAADYAKLLLHRHRKSASKHRIDVNTGIIVERENKE